MRERLGETAGAFRAVLRRDLALLRRYPLDTLAGIAATYALFLTFYVGGNAVGGDRFEESLGAIVVGFFLLTMAMTAYRALANQITNEAQWGTLERIYMSPVGFGRVMALMAVSKIGFGFVWGASILALTLATTGESLSIHVPSVAIVVVASLASVLGIGFVFGGLALRFKRVGNVTDVFQYAFFGFVVAPVERYPLLKGLPLAQGSYLLQEVMERDRRIWELAPTDLGILFAVGVAYFLAGYLVFRRAARWSRRAGVMGHY